jgi:hypothetical protein
VAGTASGISISINSAKPATTASGLWAKIPVVTHYAETVDGTLSDDLVVSLLADTERLIGPPS